MKIVQITPGVGDLFYCENCVRDDALIQALTRAGHDIVVVPLYLPPGTEQPMGRRPAPLFFGGINTYLKEKWPFCRRLPAWLTRPLDSPVLLRAAARLAGMMEPDDLGETTLSMLRGEHGRQERELQRLADWLNANERPDVVCLSNVLLAGLARRLRETLRVPILCLLQDEDSFLDELPPSHRARAWDVLRERVADIGGFIATSRYFGGVMEKRLGLPSGSVHVVYPGIPADGYSPADAAPDAPTIGFLSRTCRDKGLDALVASFVAIRQAGRLPGVRLRIAGGHTPQDAAFIGEVRSRLGAAGALDATEWLPNLERAERQRFLRSLSVLSVPARRGEASGVYVMEALACGVPVVQPRLGVFPELIEATGGGLLYDPARPGDLTPALEQLLANPSEARHMAERGRASVVARFSAELMAQEFVRVCEGVRRP